MLYFREIANHRRDHTVDGLFELAVVDMDFEPNVQGLNAGVMLQAVLSELAVDHIENLTTSSCRC